MPNRPASAQFIYLWTVFIAGMVVALAPRLRAQPLTTEGPTVGTG